MKRLLGLLIAVVVPYLLYGTIQRPSSRSAPASTVTTPDTRAPANDQAPTATRGSDAPSVVNTRVGFRSRARLEDHYQKHGREFGRITQDEYLRMAQTLRDAPAGGDVMEITRVSDGVISRFDRSSGAFLAFDPDGTIRTYFKPNDGEAYFRRQAKRAPSP
ncbi:MAG: hypothetical protein IT353_04550 [Gemmatimonadaceae bacterium]|nr:hypothetical protein [Gemmatimonadaceae bacterium]